MDFKSILEKMWNLYTGGSDVNEAIEYLMFRRYFEYEEVCKAVTKYWFHRFSNNTFFLNSIPLLDDVIYFLQMDSAKNFLSKYPSWKTDYYVDALKVQKDVAEVYLQQIMVMQTMVD
ncbi:hypothetical protein M0802_015226 [Mischocyttarus mexicanus]|nr:hypothetical protein M0802_015228 [Mischocyttarus mexicanus]KAI4475258.1 hypothetical protein M0802_015226 [Mischocyttarus mexicanus]